MNLRAHDPARTDGRPDWSSVGRVLLIRLRSIGDTVLMTPCLTALKSWRPDIELAVLSEPLAAPILEDHPLVDKLIVTGTGLAARARLIPRLRQEKFDVVFNLHGGTTATILAQLSGARHTVGYKGYRWSHLLTARAPSPDLLLGRPTLHSVEQQLALLNWSGVPPLSPPIALNITVSSEAEGRVRAAFNTLADFAVIAPAASFESKRWPAPRFAAVADHLAESWNLSSVLIAGPGQEHFAREVAALTRSRVRVLTGLCLKELTALIGMARLFVGNDSGPMHIAAALHRPVVAVFGSSNPTVWHPWTDTPYRVISGQLPEGIEQISSSRVVAAVDELMNLTVEASSPAPGT